MWICRKCGEKLDNQFDSCWRCSSPKTGAPAALATPEKTPRWRMAYRIFRGTLATWDDLFRQAADFATEIGTERVVNISHSDSHRHGVVTVWYWTPAGEREPD
jgi:hypothetical protein